MQQRWLACVAMSLLLVVASVPAIVAVVFGPGVLAARLLGLRGVAAWGVAPALSCSLVGLGGIVAELAGIRWSTWVFLLLTLVLAVVAWLLARWLPAPPDRHEPAVARFGALAGLVLGALTVVAGFAVSMGSLRRVPSQPDATYHLNAIRWMLVNGDISSRDGGVFLYDRAHSFYPSTFHGVAATAGQVVHAQPVVLANVLSVVGGALVWVLGCVLLCRQTFGCRPRAMVFGGLGAGAFTAMPYWIGGYGVLWPYLLGLALVPGVLAAVLSLAGLAQDDVIGRSRSVAVVVGGGAGLGLVHPHAVSTLAILGFVMVAVAVIGWSWRRRTPVAVGFAALAVVGPLLLWWAASQTAQIKAMSARYAVGPEETARRAAYETLLNSSRGGEHLLVTSALVLLGLVVCLRRFETRWVPVSWVVLAGLLVAVSGINSGATRALTIYWYNGIPRVAALVPFAAVPAFAAALDWLCTALLRATRRLGERPWRTPVAATVAVTAVFLVLTMGNNQGAHLQKLKPYYRPHKATNYLLTMREANSLRAIARSIPADAVVADNPWRGHALLYAFTSRRVVFYSEKAVTTPDRALVADHLAEAGSAGGAAVCSAVRNLGVTYAITGGANELGNHNGRSDFAGVDNVAGAPGFERVATVAPFTVWRVTACR